MANLAGRKTQHLFTVPANEAHKDIFLRSFDRCLYIRVQLNTLGRKLEEEFVLSDPRVEFRGLASFGSLTTLEWDRDVGRDEHGKLNFCTLDSFWQRSAPYERLIKISVPSRTVLVFESPIRS